MMEELKLSIKIALANVFLMYFKSHSYHWNVEGIHFSQYHEFFGELYSDVYGSVDPIAEELRALGDYTPPSLAQLYNFATIEEDTDVISEVRQQLLNIQDANNKVIESLNKVFDLATAAKEQGLADLAAGRIDAHKKHGWMIRSSLKNNEE